MRNGDLQIVDAGVTASNANPIAPASAAAQNTNAAYTLGALLTVNDGVTGLPVSTPLIPAANNRTVLQVFSVGASAVAVTAGGNGYSTGDTLTANGGTQGGPAPAAATFTVNQVLVTGAGMVNGGMNYVVGDTLTIPGTPARNPAFDVTPSNLITALVTERGVVEPAALAAICGSRARSR